MRTILLATLALFSMNTSAAVLNVEFNFTPFTGDPKNSTVQMVPGKVFVYVNNVLYADDQVEKKEAQVLFDNREIQPAMWLPTSSLGPALRKGKNKVRIEFEPSDPKTPYRAQFRWSSVVDQVSTGKSKSGATTQTNQADAGTEYKTATGKLVIEREFVADFATEQPWHRYPAVTSLTDEDRKRLTALVTARLNAFKPNFDAAYQILQSNKQVDIGYVRKNKCLDAAYAAGVRAVSAPADTIDFALTGNQEVVVRSKKGALYPLDEKSFAKIKGSDEVQMCAAMMLAVLYPQRFAAVRAPSGEWQVVY